MGFLSPSGFRCRIRYGHGQVLPAAVDQPSQTKGGSTSQITWRTVIGKIVGLQLLVTAISTLVAF